MGLIEKYKQFKKRRLERAITKNLKLVMNPKAIKEERVGAIDFFCQLDDPEMAVPSLLKRFDFSLEHGINDTREKEAAMEGILKFKDAVIPMVKEHLTSSSRIAWPIKVLTKLGSESQVVEVLQACLDFGDVSFDQTKIDKNYDILCHLRDYNLPGHGKNLLHFVKDQDERVRFAAVEAVLAQNDQDVAQELEHFIADDSSENTRIRQSLIHAYIQNKWSLRNKNQFSPGTLLPGVKVSHAFLLEGDEYR